MIDAVKNKKAYMATAGIPITSQRMNEGLSFSLPTFKSGLRLAARNKAEGSLWSFLDPFTGSLWWLIVGTTLVTAFLAFFFEGQSTNFKSAPIALKNLSEMIWQAFSSLFFASEIRLQKLSSRMMFLCFWFIILILTAVYTADLTTKLATKKSERKLLYGIALILLLSSDFSNYG